MKIVHEEILINQGGILETHEWQIIRAEIHQAIASVVWPTGSSQFTINPSLHGNGVKPIKEGCMLVLRDKFGWQLEAPVFIREANRPGAVDALRDSPLGNFIFEWETGNISSSHRALNKIALGIIRNLLLGGVLVLPTRKLYPYLTDRIGNYEELLPYFPVWKALPIERGLMLVIAIEHDATDSQVARISKGTDGRALV
ncbi:MAG: restriction endonuclease [Chloroflexota bacterium]|nr:restriction endonuclease [Chloroflexota bacterium]